ncbi:uncharacterized protein LOC144880936 isoform X2 [Branchiostoma floridae x Branchiostoma japonicum]
MSRYWRQRGRKQGQVAGERAEAWAKEEGPSDGQNNGGLGDNNTRLGQRQGRRQREDKIGAFGRLRSAEEMTIGSSRSPRQKRLKQSHHTRGTRQVKHLPDGDSGTEEESSLEADEGASGGPTVVNITYTIFNSNLQNVQLGSRNSMCIYKLPSGDGLDEAPEAGLFSPKREGRGTRRTSFPPALRHLQAQLQVRPSLSKVVEVLACCSPDVELPRSFIEQLLFQARKWGRDSKGNIRDMYNTLLEVVEPLVKVEKNRVYLTTKVRDIWEHLSPTEKQKSLMHMAQCVGNVYDTIDDDSWQKGKELLPHVKTFYDYLKSLDKEDLLDFDLALHIAYCFCRMGQVSVAFRLTQTCTKYDIDVSVLTPDDVALAKVYRAIGDFERKKGNLQNARTAFSLAKKILTHVNKQRRVCNEDCVSYLGVLLSESRACLDQGKFDRARELLKLCAKAPAFDRMTKYRQTRYYSFLGRYYEETGQYKSALDCYRRARSMTSPISYRYPVNVINEQRMAAACAMGVAQITNAIEECEKMKPLLLKDFGEEHPHLGLCYKSLAEMYLALQQTEQTLDLLYASFAILFPKYGRKHKKIANLFMLLGKTVECVGGSKSDDAAYKAFKVAQKLYGTGHPNFAVLGERIETILEIVSHDAANFEFLVTEVAEVFENVWKESKLALV